MYSNEDVDCSAECLHLRWNVSDVNGHVDLLIEKDLKFSLCVSDVIDENKRKSVSGQDGVSVCEIERDVTDVVEDRKKDEIEKETGKEIEKENEKETGVSDVVYSVCSPSYDCDMSDTAYNERKERKMRAAMFDAMMVKVLCVKNGSRVVYSENEYIAVSDDKNVKGAYVVYLLRSVDLQLGVDVYWLVESLSVVGKCLDVMSRFETYDVYCRMGGKVLIVLRNYTSIVTYMGAILQRIDDVLREGIRDVTDEDWYGRLVQLPVAGCSREEWNEIKEKVKV